MKHIATFALALMGVFYASNAAAQLVVTNSAPNNQPSHLIQNVFMGGSISAFNFKYNGSTAATISTNQVGYFTGGGNIFGIDSGLVMSTGNIFLLPNNTFASASYNGAGDADVLQVAQSVGWGTPPTIMRDKAVLEFDFVAPSDDSVAFEYVFGSEEWPTYPCSSFNDAFGFFISGPGISGAYSNSAVNISVVPGTASLPVAITSIHLGNNINGNACQYPSYAQYYNNGPTTQPFAFCTQNTGQSSGAFTDVFMTKAVHVNACDTYHVKLAICDGQDWIFDSAVFLKAKSFNFLGITVNPTPTYNPWGFDTALYEGCGQLELFFSRVDSTYEEYDLHYKLGGTAQYGIDYSQVSGCTANSQGGYDCVLTFPQDSTTTNLVIDIFHDNLNEIFESLLIIIDDSNVTNCSGSDTLELTIVDQPLLNVSAYGATTLDCNDDSAAIGVSVTGGLPPFTFEWNTGSTDSTFNVMPSITSSYTVTVEDACGYQTAFDFVTVGVFNVPWSVTKYGDEQTISCISPPAILAVGVQFNDGVWHGDIDYQWSTGETDSVISLFSTVDTTVSVTITRNCTGESEVRTFHLYTYNDPVVLHTEDIPEEMIACPGDPVTIHVAATGGYEPYTYQWSTAALDQDSFTVVAPLLTTTYTVTVHDVCALVDYVDQVVVNVPIADPLRIDGLINDTVPCPEQKVFFGDAVASGGFHWGFKFSWDDFATESNKTSGFIYEDTPFTIKLTDGCGVDTASLTVWGIIAEKNDLILSTTADTTICAGKSITLEAEGMFGGGDYRYYWNDLKTEGTNKLKVLPTQSTIYTVRLEDACDTIRRAEIAVNVSEIEAGFDYEYINDYEVQFSDKTLSTDGIKWYEWTIEKAAYTSSEQSPLVSLPDGNPYEVKLRASNEFGCTDVATVIIQPEYHLYVPSAFTPNRDNKNDGWSIGSTGIREMRLEVYDRWGRTVYATTDKNFLWDGFMDGNRLPMGVYVWRIVLWTDLDEYVEREGTVTLLNDFDQR